MSDFPVDFWIRLNSVGWFWIRLKSSEFFFVLQRKRNRLSCARQQGLVSLCRAIQCWYWKQEAASRGAADQKRRQQLLVEFGELSSWLHTGRRRPALLEWILSYPFFPLLRKLFPCVRKPVLCHDFVATLLPYIIQHIVILPNDLRLLLAWKWEHPEYIIQGVKHAPPKDVHLFRRSAIHCPAKNE